MTVELCNAKKFCNDKFGFFKILDAVGMDGIGTPWKFTDYSCIDVLEDLMKRFSFYFIKSMSMINYPFNDELSQGGCFNDTFIANFNSALI